MNKDGQNPYEVLEAEPELLPNDGEEMRVDGSDLWVRSVCHLPLRCVFSNHPGSIQDYQEHNLVWKGRSFRLKLQADTVVLNCIISAPYRRLMRIRRWLYGLPTAMLPAVVIMSSSWQWLLGGVVLMVLAELGFSLWSRRLDYGELTVSGKHEGYFRVTGMGPQFLRSLEAELESREQSGKLYQPATFAEEPLE